MGTGAWKSFRTSRMRFRWRIHSDAAFLPGQPGDHPSPSRKARAIVGQATGEGDEKDKRILRWMTIALKRHASFLFTKSCARISSPSLQMLVPRRRHKLGFWERRGNRFR